MDKPLIKRIGLGSVQFGLDYGINNSSGKVSPAEVQLILSKANQSGINTIDTAAEYGNSETVIGNSLKSNSLSFNIVSKFSLEKISLKENIETSLKNMAVNELYGYLFHRFEDFKNNPDSIDELNELKENNKIKKPGFSLYHPVELTHLLEKKIDFQLIQIPYNIFDRRFEPYFEILKDKNIEIHIRSVFLQGLFFIPHSKLHPHFNSVREKIKSLQDICVKESIAINDLLLNFVLLNNNIDKAIIGANNVVELEKNIESLKVFEKVKSLKQELDKFTVSDEQIILPFNWKL